MNKYRFHFKTLKTKKTKGFPIKIARGLQRERNRELCENAICQPGQILQRLIKQDENLSLYIRSN